jgi:predicted aldo/keto reductase-like oxidoreductase
LGRGGPQVSALAHALGELAAAWGYSPAQLALAWLLDHGTDSVPIPGTRHIDRLDENAAAADIKLSDAQRTQMAAMLAAHPVAGAAKSRSKVACSTGSPGQFLPFGALKWATGQCPWLKLTCSQQKRRRLGEPFIINI